MRVSHVQYRLRPLAARNPGEASAELQRRLTLVRAVLAAARAMPICDACAEVGVSKATFYRWAARLEAGGVAALEPRSRRPKRPTPPTVRRRIREAVEALRRDSTSGKEKLVVLLARQGLHASASTIGRCLRDLFARGVIDRYAPRGRARTARPKPPRPHAVRTPKRLTAHQPGDVLQVDTLHIEWTHASWRQFSGIDLATRHASALLTSRATSRNATRFLQQLLATSPYPIRAIQVDQGSEYKDAFEDACARLGITLYENHARAPQQNAHVERLQRTFRDEFYRRTPLPPDLTTANKALQSYLHHYNHHRPHAGLRYLTPHQYLHMREPLFRLT